MPKGTDLSDASQIGLNEVAALINNRPRKTLGSKTPAETMPEEMAAFNGAVARATWLRPCHFTVTLRAAGFADTGRQKAVQIIGRQENTYIRYKMIDTGPRP